jgi:putative PIN family toxin of toxin-antitoxin system
MLRIVLDTDVFVSSLLSAQSLPAQVLNAWREGKYMLVVSPLIIAEIAGVLESSRISNKYSITRTDIEGLVDLLETDTIVVPGQAVVAGAVPQDPRDEIFLACAVDSNADCIVSGDRHLLDMETYKDIPILTVKEFAEKLEKQMPRWDGE